MELARHTADVARPVEGEPSRPKDEPSGYDWDAFVSYAHADAAIVHPIVEHLEAAGWSVWLDRHDLEAGARLTQELPTGVRDAHTLLFMMSPRSVASRWCIDELDAAIGLGRRIVPVVLDPDTQPPPQLEDYLRFEPTEPGNAEAVAEKLAGLLSHDLVWVKGHRRWSSEAARWDTDGRPRGLLLSGHRLEVAEGWRTGQSSRVQPRMTQTLAEFLAVSRETENARLRRQRLAISIAACALGVFGAGALIFGLIARDRAATAGSRELAARANAMLPFDPAGSRLLAERAERRKRTHEAAAARQEAALEDRLLAGPYAGGVPPDAPGVAAVVYAPDGRLLITGGDDGRIRLWDGRTGAPRGEARTDQEVRSLEIDRTGHRLVVATSSALELWDVACLVRAGGSGCRRRTVAARAQAAGRAGDAAIVTAVADQGATRVVTFVDGVTMALVWGADLHRVAMLRLRSPVTAVAISHGGNRIATGTRAGRVAVWDANGHRIAEGPRHRLAVSALGFGPGGVLASGSADGTVRLWRPGRASPIRLLGKLPGQVQRLAMSRAGYLAAGGESGVIFEWQLGTGRFIGALAGHTGIISALRYGRDGRRLFSASDEGRLRVWESATGGTRAVMAGHRSRVQAIAVSPAGDRAASVSGDGELRIWDVRRDTSTVELVGHTGAIPSVAYSRDGSRVVTASLDATARVWDAHSGRLIRTITAPAPLQAAAFGPRGSIIVTDWEGMTSRWEPGSARPSWRVPACPHQPCGKAYTLAVAPGGRLVAAGSEHGAVLLDASSGQPIRRLQGDAFVYALQFDAAGTRLLTAYSDGHSTINPTSSSGRAVTLPQLGSEFYEARIAPDGRTALTAGVAGACIWTISAEPRCTKLELPADAGRLYTGDLQTRPFRAVVAGSSGTAFAFASPGGRPLRLEGHTGAIERVRLSAGGSRVVSIGQDATSRVWDPSSGARIARLTGATTGLLDLTFDPTSRRVAVASNDGTARIYPWK